MSLGCVAAVLLALGGCSSAPARVALGGDLAALDAAIATAEREGELGAPDVKELARAVLRRELASLGGPHEQFPDVLPCARSVRSSLEDVAAGDGAFAGWAAVTLIDAGFEPPEPPPEAATARAAIEARQALGVRAGGRRRALMLHGDASVRRAALLAALASADPSDRAALGEAARLDPDLGARALAIRGLARIGGQDAALTLIDLYPGAPPEIRRELVHAWSIPATFAAGGERALEDLASAGADEAAVLAALSLHGRSDAATALAERALVRAIEGGAAGARLLALELAPWGGEGVRAALASARSHSDPATRALALLRRVEASALEPADTAELEKLAADTGSGAGAVARAALAEARAGGEPGPLHAALRADLEAKRAEQRMLAALTLLSLEDWPGTARALGDDSPAVRRSLACRVLAEAGVSRPGSVAAGTARRPQALLPPPLSGPLVAAPGTAPGGFPDVVPLLVGAAPPG